MSRTTLYKHLEGLTHKKVEVVMASGTPEECVKSGIVLACDQTNGTIDIRYDDAHVESGLLVGSSFQDGDVFRLTDTYLLNAERADPHPARILAIPETSCGKCQNDANTSAQSKCLSLEAHAVASKGVYAGHMSTLGRHACLKRIQLQVNSFSGDKKMFRNATLVDFDPFTYRHQLIFDDGSTEDRRLWAEVIRPLPEELAKRDPKWLVALKETGVEGPLAGGFGCRDYRAHLAGQAAKLYSRATGTWADVTVTGFDLLYNKHMVQFGDGTQAPVNYEEQVLYTPEGPPAGMDVPNEDSEPETDVEDMVATAVATKQPPSKRGRGRPKTGERARRSSPATGRKRKNPAETGRGNPITALPAHVTYGDVMTWVADFLTGDPRVPAHIRAMMSMHLKVRDSQLARGLATTHPSKFYSHALSEAGLNVPQGLWGDENAVRESIVQADDELQTTWIAQQGMVNTIFVPCTRKKIAPKEAEKTKGAKAGAGAEEPEAKRSKVEEDPEDTDADEGFQPITTPV